MVSLAIMLMKLVEVNAIGMKEISFEKITRHRRRWESPILKRKSVTIRKQRTTMAFCYGRYEVEDTQLGVSNYQTCHTLSAYDWTIAWIFHYPSHLHCHLRKLPKFPALAISNPFMFCNRQISRNYKYSIKCYFTRSCFHIDLWF